MSCVAVAVAAAPAAAGPSAAPLPPCAPTVSPDALKVGQKAIGYTVSHGTTVESFDAEVLGVMPDGIAPGRDLIVVETSGPSIDEAGGIWFGMSGSPVYTLGGKFIGAVSYGFSATSPMAGLTPADPDMLDLLDLEASSALTSPGSASPDRAIVRLSPAVRARVARQPGVRGASVGGSMSQLEVPLSISGVTPQHRATLRHQAIKHHLPFFIPSVGGSSASGKGLVSGTIHPGDSFAAAISYGDITAAGIGTTSYVCDGQALAFGHPFFFTGPNRLGASGASALGIVEDPVFGPYKLANVTDSVGMVDQDRLPGLRAQLGQAPPLVSVKQHTKSLDTGAERTGQTDIVRGANVDREESLPFISWIHSFSNIDSVFDQVSGGSAHISWTIRGIEKPSGKRWKLTRGNRWVSPRDISFEATSELPSTLHELEQQHLARIALTGIDVNVDVEQTVHELAIRKVLWSTDGRHYRHKRILRVRAGERIFAKVKMRDSDRGQRRTESLKLRVPRHSGSVGLVSIGGGNSGGVDFLCAVLGRCGHTKAKDFDSLIKKLEGAPRNDELVVSLRTRRKSSRVVERQPKVVSGQEQLLLLISSGNGHGGRGIGIGVPTPSP
jgi:hypothetical protein